MNPRVVKVKTDTDYSLHLTFENGEKRIFDMRPYLSIGIFKKLKSPVAFKSAKAVLGSVRWKGGQDLCPDTLYEESVTEKMASSLVLAGEKHGKYSVKKTK